MDARMQIQRSDVHSLGSHHLLFTSLPLEKTQTKRRGLRLSVFCTELSDFEMAEPHDGNPTAVAKETAFQALNGIIQLHFEKTLEKKRAVDKQKKKLWHLYQLFFLFLAVAFSSQFQSPPSRLQCRHCWAPIALLSLGHLVFYVSVAQTLRCINGFKYQRRCHKLTLGLATERLKQMKGRCGAGELGFVGDMGEFEIHYQEPPESYLVKFKRNWALHFGFLICTFAFAVSASVVVLCF